MSTTVATIPLTLRLDDTTHGVVHCEHLVKAIPGKRLVYLAHWQQQPVFAKLYVGIGRRRRWQRELAGLQALHTRAIPAPTVYYAGTAAGGQVRLILLLPLQPAQSLQAIWNQNTDLAQRAALLGELMELIARHHKAGLKQQDPNLNNFLRVAGTLYTLDGDTVRATRRPLGKRQALANLARLFARLDGTDDQLVSIALPVYAIERGWPLTGLELALRRYLAPRRRRRCKRYLANSLRSNQEYVRRLDGKRAILCRRSHLSPALDTLLSDPDASLHWAETRLLTGSDRHTVWLTTLAGHTLEIRRYTRPGWCLGRKDAVSAWLDAHRRLFYGKPTPLPVALIEERLSGCRRLTYFITEAV